MISIHLDRVAEMGSLVYFHMLRVDQHHQLVQMYASQKIMT